MKYLMVCVDESTLFKYLHKDLVDSGQISMYYLNKKNDSKIKKYVKRLHTSLRVNSILDLPYKNLYYGDLYEIITNNEIDCIIFQNMSAGKLGKRFLRRLHEKYFNVKLVLLLFDSFSAHSKNLPLAWKSIGDYSWDSILSYDIYDCNKYGFTYLGYCYYSMYESCNTTMIENDIFYIGANKKNDGRLDIVTDIANKLKDSVKCSFRILDFYLNDLERKKLMNIGINFMNKQVEYTEVINDVNKSNCILEILQDGQQMQTLRYFEAVCYNKKLLTNNPEIVNLPYYDSRYMKVFSKAEDIDIEWVKKRENIDYGYKGDFSPVGILKIIEDKFNINK